ncbi:nitroreductase family protein [Methanofollis aquaemaris]|uniref:Nitroreductase family protein n=1 Tax=Methanofollis aquaemaris TaxID=126734 RepID=A0A8A3S8J0_9EURY|nr:nitroreductase family protein [Methanofollis aquaemaris]QSZ67994.1 nitroreductase family protein [Methanofollis aquaemaris]
MYLGPNLGLTILKTRHSIRKYKEDPIEEKIIENALECARLAPTARNEQPWLFGVVKEKETLKQIADLTDHGTFIEGAPICFAVFGKRDAKYYLEDCSAATTQLILGLWAYGVGSCWVAGEKKEYADAVRELLGVPEEYTLVSLLPAGYPMDVKIAGKKALDEIVFEGQYSQR